VCAVEPEAPWETLDMSCLEMIEWDLQGGRKLVARKSRKREVYARSIRFSASPMN